nr:hypothetical protein [Tanacetum cinerariifolium]
MGAHGRDMSYLPCWIRRIGCQNRFVSNFIASQYARLSKFEANFKQQQGEMTNKIDTFLKAINDRMTGTLLSETVKNPKLNVNSTSLVLYARSYIIKDPQCSSHPLNSIIVIKLCPKQTNEIQKDQPQVTLTVNENGRPPKKGIKSPSKLLSLKYQSQSSLGEKNKSSTSPKHVYFINIINIISKEDEPRETWVVKPDTKDKDHNIIVKVDEESEESEEEKEEEEKEEEDNPVYTNPPLPSNPSISFITEKIYGLNNLHNKIEYIDVDVEINLEKAQTEAYNLDLDHQEKVLSMMDVNEEEPVDVEEVLEVVKTAKLMTEVVTTAGETKVSVPIKRRRVIIQDHKERTTTATVQPKGMTYGEIRPLFKKHYNYNQAFLDEVNKGVKVSETKVRQEKDVEVESSKRKGGSLKQEIAKKQKMEEETEELKKHLQIVTDDDDDVDTDATPLSLKIPIVDYKIHTERDRPYFKIIRADGNHMLLISLSTMLKNFDREDLESHWKIMRDRFKKTKPKNYSDDYLLNTFKIMFERPNVETSAWKDKKGRYGLAKVKSRKLIESCGVHCIISLNTQIFLLVERMYPLTHFTLEQMLDDVRLQVDDESKMSLELLMLGLVNIRSGVHARNQQQFISQTDENTTNPQQVPPTLQASHTLLTIKLPILKKEGSHKGYDRFQSLLSQLKTHGESVSTKDANKKFLRSLPSSWSRVSLIMRTKPEVDTLNFDNLYNNLRVFESDVKGSTGSSLSTQNVVDEFDLEEMDLKWQVAIISTRLKKFYKKTRRKLHFDAKKLVGFDKSKVECFNCHNTGHFARECRSKGNQDSRRRDAGNTGYKARDNGKRSIKQDKHKAMVTNDGEGFDWTGHVEDDTSNYALMAFNSSNSGSDTEVELNKQKGKSTGPRENRPVWNNVQRLNHQNKFVPMAILTKTVKFLVNAARQNFSSRAASTSTAKKVNTARPKVNKIRPRHNVYKSHSPIRRPLNRTTTPKANFSQHKVNTTGDKSVSVVGGAREEHSYSSRNEVLIGDLSSFLLMPKISPLHVVVGDFYGDCMPSGEVMVVHHPS